MQTVNAGVVLLPLGLEHFELAFEGGVASGFEILLALTLLTDLPLEGF